MESLLGKAFEIGNKAVSALSSIKWGKTPFDVVELQQSVFQKSFVVITNAGVQVPFILAQENNRDATLHVIYKTKNEKLMSVRRMKLKLEAEECFKSFAKHGALFGVIGQDLQSVSNLVSSVHAHPEWQSCNLASLLGLVDYFRLPQLSNVQMVNMACMPEGQFPLQIACQAGHSNVVSELMLFKAQVEKLDPNGLNSVHYATLSTENAAKVIQILAQGTEFKNCVNVYNGAGYTPLFLAIRNRNSAAVTALIVNGARTDLACRGKTVVQEAAALGSEPSALKTIKALSKLCPKMIIEQDKSGNTALHDVSDAQILDVMLMALGLDTNINVTNSAGQTPLHVAANRGHLSCLVKLLAYGADPDTTDSQQFTALHISVHRANTERHVIVVKALLVFGAKPSMKNNKGQIPLDLCSNIHSITIRDSIKYCLTLFMGQSKTVQRNPELTAMSEFAQTLALSETVKRLSDAANNKRKVVNLLALDGGGIRGLVLIQILIHIESVLGSSVWEKFHWVAGTSTGGILAVALSLGRSIRECQQLYFRFKDQVFVGTRPYNTSILEEFLKKEIGPERTMGSIENPSVAIDLSGEEFGWRKAFVCDSKGKTGFVPRSFLETKLNWDQNPTVYRGIWFAGRITVDVAVQRLTKTDYPVGTFIICAPVNYIKEFGFTVFALVVRLERIVGDITYLESEEQVALNIDEGDIDPPPIDIFRIRRDLHGRYFIGNSEHFVNLYVLVKSLSQPNSLISAQLKDGPPLRPGQKPSTAPAPPTPARILYAQQSQMETAQYKGIEQTAPVKVTAKKTAADKDTTKSPSVKKAVRKPTPTKVKVEKGTLVKDALETSVPTVEEGTAAVIEKSTPDKDAVEVSAPTKAVIEMTTPSKDSVEIAKPQQDTIEMTTPSKDSVEIAKPQQDTIEMTTPSKDSVEIAKPQQDTIEMTTPSKDSVEIAKPQQDTIEMTTPSKDSVEIAKPQQDTIEMTTPSEDTDDFEDAIVDKLDDIEGYGEEILSEEEIGDTYGTCIEGLSDEEETEEETESMVTEKAVENELRMGQIELQERKLREKEAELLQKEKTLNEAKARETAVWLGEIDLQQKKLQEKEAELLHKERALNEAKVKEKELLLSQVELQQKKLREKEAELEQKEKDLEETKVREVELQAMKLREKELELHQREMALEEAQLREKEQILAQQVSSIDKKETATTPKQSEPPIKESETKSPKQPSEYLSVPTKATTGSEGTPHIEETYLMRKHEKIISTYSPQTPK